MSISPHGRLLRRAAILLAGALLVSVLASCVVQQTITLNPDGSGTAVTDVKLQEFFSSYLMDLAEFSGQKRDPEKGIFDVTQIRQLLTGKQGVQVKDARQVSPREVQVSVSFAGVQDLAGGDNLLTKTGILTFSRQGQRKELRVHFDRDNYKQLADLIPGVDQTLLDMFGPQEGVYPTEEEYLQMMEFALGEQGPKAVKESTVDVEVTVKGRILSQKGGTLKDQHTVVFAIPLLKLLMLEKPLDYSLVFN